MTPDQLPAAAEGVQVGIEEDAEPDLQALLAAIVENTDDAVVSKTLNGIIRTWNTGAERIFGWTAAEAIGQPITIIIPPEREHEEADILARLRRGERVDHFETVRLHKSGRRLDISVTISPIRDRHGHVVAASKIARDITLFKDAQRQLLAAKQEAERANRIKDQFLSTLSHELRTPLTPALAEISFLEESATLAARLRTSLAMVRRNLETEARLVDDLLDVTRIQTGKLQLQRAPMDLHAAIYAAIRMQQPQIDSKQLRLTVALHASRHGIVGDAVRIQQILLNLLSNAVKFTPAGGGIEVATRDGDDGCIQLSVRDEGPGVDPELMPRLFERFEQGTRSGGGLGLGLAIAHELAELHGGTLTAASGGSGHGATFTLSLPATAAKPAAEPRAPARLQPLARRLRVLLVEDHADTRQAMALLLGALGCQVEAVGTVREAIGAGERERFDVLLCDLGLPDGSGMEIMEHLRSQPIHGIALTGFGQAEIAERSRAVGFERHIIKPVTFQRLRELLMEFAQAS